MPGFIPQVGTKGLWQLLAPFQALLVANVPYTNIAIRAIADIIAAGEDPQALYYTPVGLTSTQYENDVAASTYIVTLQNPSGAVIYVPSTYLTSFPDIGGVPYTTIFLTVNLGAIPDSMNLSLLQSKISDDVQELIGVKASVTPVVASAQVIIPNAQDAAITAARNAIIGTVTTDYANYLTAQANFVSATQKIQLLESYIMSLNPSPNNVTVVLSSMDTAWTPPSGVTSLVSVIGNGATAGTPSTIFGLSFTGLTNGIMPTTQYSTVPVTANTTYPVTIQTGGAIVITYTPAN